MDEGSDGVAGCGWLSPCEVPREPTPIEPMPLGMLREITGMTTVSHTATSARHVTNLECVVLRKAPIRHSAVQAGWRQASRPPFIVNCRCSGRSPESPEYRHAMAGVDGCISIRGAGRRARFHPCWSWCPGWPYSANRSTLHVPLSTPTRLRFAAPMTCGTELQPDSSSGAPDCTSRFRIPSPPLSPAGPQTAIGQRFARAPIASGG